MQHHAARLPAKEITVQLAVHSIAQAQLVQRFHNAAFEQHTAVLLRIPAPVPCGTAGAARSISFALCRPHSLRRWRRMMALFLQFPAFRVREVAQQVHAMLMLMVIAGQLGGREQAHAVLHRVLIAVVHAEQGCRGRKWPWCQPARAAMSGRRWMGTEPSEQVEWL